MDIVDRLVELVGVPSVSGGEEQICDRVAALCAAAKPLWRHARIGNNLVLGPDPAAGAGPRIAFVGHLDTVPPQGNAEPVVRDDRVYGVGSTDMKAGVAVMCDLIERLPSADLPVRPLFVFYDKEEAGFDENGLGRLLPRSPDLREVDFAFVLEPTNLRLELGCTGHLNARVTFSGQAAHSARPWMGKNAIHAAGEFITKIASIPVREVKVAPVSYREVISITLAEGGVARNVIPERFTLNVNYRYPPDRDADTADRYVRGLVPEDASVELIDAGPPGRVPRENAVFDRFRARFPLDLAGKQGWTDVARLTHHGIDAVNFGPGIPELCHRRDEHVPIDQLTRCRDMLFEFVTEYPR
jgi:succinyl-diaminopimelate desuccinylase